MSKLVGAREFFDAIARKYDRSYAPERDVSKARLANVVALLPKTPARILDLGIGTGRELPALFDAGHEVVGVDIAPQMIELVAKRSRPAEVVLLDFWRETLPFDDASFDAVIALHGSLAHPPEEAPEAMKKLANELARVTKKTAIVIVEVPSPGFVKSLTGADVETARATGADRLVHEDKGSDVAIEARAFPPERWIEAFSGHFETSVTAISPVEQLVVARRME